VNLTRWAERFVRWLSALSAVALACMVLLVVADVLRSNFLHRPIIGTFDLVQTLLVFIVFLGIPQIFFIEGNITVDVIDHLAGRRVVACLRVLGGLLSFAYLGLLWEHMFAPALDALRFGDVTSDLGMPVFIMWLPVLFGLPVALIAIIFVILRQLRHLRETGKTR
jgi:TRAP-type C4-dicarboxylate transport system permease small subunit